MTVIGKIIWINGPVVKASGMAKSKMHELVYVGVEELIGEIIRIQGDMAYIQIYEDTSGLKPGEPVRGTGQPLSVTLGPGLIGSIFDGIQRPLNKISLTAGAFISRGVKVSPIPLDEKWHFIPETRRDKVKPGDILGYVKENDVILHKIMVPPNVSGKLIDIVDEGKYKANETIAIIEKNSLKISLTMIQKWPVRIPRPFKNKLSPRIPLITGTRVIDTFFPVAKGGTACIPGGFGTGKTVLLHQISSWNNAKIVIYIGCGERGNEMSEILIRFPKIEDPYSGKPLMHRTIMIANTSNMPVVAREASIYTGVTLGEYYRDMGYDVVIVADSTSRWAEALREVSGRLEEM
ncbi:MAG: V-type ATP synthase subunit A, partial [Thermoprotei archaeon]